jgi:hypothetical protein
MPKLVDSVRARSLPRVHFIHVIGNWNLNLGNGFLEFLELSTLSSFWKLLVQINVTR